MNREIFTHARNQIKDIIEESSHILPDHNLIFHETTIGFELSQFWDGWTPYINGFSFGSHRLNRKQAQRIIKDNEYLSYL